MWGGGGGGGGKGERVEYKRGERDRRVGSKEKNAKGVRECLQSFGLTPTISRVELLDRDKVASEEQDSNSSSKVAFPRFASRVAKLPAMEITARSASCLNTFTETLQLINTGMFSPGLIRRVTFGGCIADPFSRGSRWEECERPSCRTEDKQERSN